jgi:hypothetical protein
MSDVELVQVVVSVDGALCRVVIPQECKPVLLRLMQGLCEGGTLEVVRLPDSVGLIPLRDVIKSES